MTFRIPTSTMRRWLVGSMGTALVLAWLSGPSVRADTVLVRPDGTDIRSASVNSTGPAPTRPAKAPPNTLDFSGYHVKNKIPEGYRAVGFAQLGGFRYDSDWEDMPAGSFAKPKRRAHPKREIPTDILALNGAKVVAIGFMLPFEYEEEAGTTSRFGLMKNQNTCCYGVPLNLNEWIDVHPVHPMHLKMDTPILVRGTLSVKEIRKNGNTLGLYAIAAESLEEAQIPGWDQ